MGGGAFKLEPNFYLRAKLEKVHRAAGCLLAATV